MRKLSKSQRGFTLIELLVVIGILGIIAAVVIPNVGRFIGVGEAEAAATEQASIQVAVDCYMVEHGGGALPENAAGIQDFAVTVLSGGTLAVPLYPTYLRDQIAQYATYYWGTDGEVETTAPGP